MMQIEKRQPPFPRQPDQIVWVPSNPCAWYGFPSKGERFTSIQLAELGRHGIDPAAVEAITVYREATTAEMYWSTYASPPVFQFDCPVMGRRADGKVKILSPAGDLKWVHANGWVRWPSKLNRHLVERVGNAVTAAGVAAGALLLVSMLARIAIAQLPHSPVDASTAARVASTAASIPHAPAVVEAGRGPQDLAR